MEEVLKRAADQVPSLVVLVIVVVVFLRQLKSQAAEFSTTLTDQRQAFVGVLKEVGSRSEDIAEACHEVTRETAQAVKENSRLIARVEKMLEGK